MVPYSEKIVMFPLKNRINVKQLSVTSQNFFSTRRFLQGGPHQSETEGRGRKVPLTHKLKGWVLLTPFGEHVARGLMTHFD